MRPERKLFSSLESLSSACAVIRQLGQTLVLTSGCFDILHIGHGIYVNDAAELGQRLIVGINSDEFVRRLKGPDRPYRPEDDRAYTMACFEAVDGVIVFDDDLDLIRAVNPAIYVVYGKSHVLLEDDPPRQALLKELGTTVRQLDSGKVNSTTSLLTKVRQA